MRPFLKRTSIIGCVDDDPGVHAVLGGDRGAGEAPAAGAVGDEPLEAVVGFQRIAAGGDEAEHLGEAVVAEAGVGRGGADFGEQLGLVDRAGAGEAEDMLGEDVDRAGAEDFGVELAGVDRVERGAGLEIFEAVAGDDHALRRLVEAVVGAADPLEQARAALGRAHLDDQIDVAPVDAEVEAGGGDQRAQLARAHRRLDLAARFQRQAAVVDADAEALVVDLPQILENQLGEAAGVAEDERGLVRFDQLHHLRARRSGPNGRTRARGLRG